MSCYLRVDDDGVVLVAGGDGGGVVLCLQQGAGGGQPLLQLGHLLLELLKFVESLLHPRDMDGDFSRHLQCYV